MVALSAGAQAGSAKLGAALASATEATTGTATMSRRSCISVYPPAFDYVLRNRDLPGSRRDQSRPVRRGMRQICLHHSVPDTRYVGRRASSTGVGPDRESQDPTLEGDIHARPRPRPHGGAVVLS